MPAVECILDNTFYVISPQNEFGSRVLWVAEDMHTVVGNEK